MDNFNDFDEDIDDILLSDDETNKKYKKTTNILNKENNVIKNNTPESGKITKNSDNSVTQSTSSKNRNSQLFEDSDDHMTMMDTPKLFPKKSQDSNKKGAKAVLDSLLNPVSELDDFSFSKSHVKSKDGNVSNNLVEEKKSAIDDDFWKTSGYQPSAGGPKLKDNNTREANKRTVRFSSDGIQDSELDSSVSLQGRPVTAPSISTEGSKSKFVSRFEEAEYNDVLPKHSDKFNSESEPNLWRTSISDDFLGQGSLETKLKNEGEEVVDKNKDGHSRSNPKQKLTEFLQTSNDDIFSRPVQKNQHSPLELSGKSSTEDFHSPIRSTKLEESFSSRRASIQADSVFERPRTGYGRSEGFESEQRRRSSVQVDMLFERPRTGHGRIETVQNKPDMIRNERSDLDLQLKHIQSERDDLLYRLEVINKRNKEEMEIVDKSYKNRIELMEDNIERKEKRFREEIEMLSQQNKQKLEIIESERMEMRAELSRRQDDMENQKRHELSRVREQHQLELDRLRLNHEDLVEKLRHAKSEEDSTIRMAQPTTNQLQSVLTQVSNGAYDLASLKQQFLDQMNQQMKVKETELKSKNDSLRQLEEQLNIQKQENSNERERLQSLIAKLDIQLKEQAKQSDEERWYLRQEQNKLSVMQASLEKEREHILSEKDQNRSSYEEFRTKLLEEQKQLFNQIYEEKRSLAEERAKLTREVSKWSESSQITTTKKQQESAELEGIRAALADERRELESMRAQIFREREENIQKTAQVSSLSYDIRLKSEKLNQLELELAERKNNVEAKERDSNLRNQSGEEALRKAKEIQSSHQEQLTNIHNQLILLNEKEKQINKELIELEKVRLNVINQNKSAKCSKCSNLLRDSAIGGSLNNINNIAPQRIPKAPVHRKVDSYLDQGIHNSMEYSYFVSDQLEEERLIHSIKRAADEDREYLENERAFLRSLTMKQDNPWRSQVKS